MKIRILLLIVAIFSFKASYSQNVDLDKFYFNVKFQKLPNVKTNLEERKYSFKVIAKEVIKPHVDEISLSSKLNVYGWQLVPDNATVKVTLTFEDFLQVGSDIRESRKETKDSQGKVVSSVVVGYYMQSNYAHRGFCVINAPKSAVELKATVKQIEEKEKKIASNRFLANTQSAPKKETENENEYILRFNETMIHNSSVRLTQKEVYDDVAMNKSNLFQENLRKFTDNTIASVMNHLNEKYGFQPTEEKDYLWILDNKNEEGKTQLEAIGAIKTIFNDAAADKPTTQLEEELKPLMDYFNSMKKRYTGTTKADKKMRYAACYNLSKIYYHLDKPEDAKKEGQLLIDNDYDTKDGKRLIERAQVLLDEFNTKQIYTRHNPKK